MLKANKLYRWEDIMNMSFSNVNPGLGPRGSNNYNIAEWKGGVNCKHYWERITFVKKGLEGSIDTRSPIAERNALSETTADNRGMRPDISDLVGKTPHSMPSKGRLTFIKELFKKKKDATN
jgi:hypothetical protein